MLHVIMGKGKGWFSRFFFFPGRGWFPSQVFLNEPKTYGTLDISRLAQGKGKGDDPEAPSVYLSSFLRFLLWGWHCLGAGFRAYSPPK